MTVQWGLLIMNDFQMICTGWNECPFCTCLPESCEPPRWFQLVLKHPKIGLIRKLIWKTTWQTSVLNILYLPLSLRAEFWCRLLIVWLHANFVLNNDGCKDLTFCLHLCDQVVPFLLHCMVVKLFSHPLTTNVIKICFSVAFYVNAMVCICCRIIISAM